MFQIFENIWNLIQTIFDFIVTAFTSLLDGVVFCYTILGHGLVYIAAFGPTVVALITIIFCLFVIWLILRIVHG